MPNNEKDHPPRLSFNSLKLGNVLSVGPPPEFPGLPGVRLLLRDKRNGGGARQWSESGRGAGRQHEQNIIDIH